MTTSSSKNKSHPIRLLLVDDEKNFVDILSKRMQRRNIDVFAAFGGAEAIRALRKHDFDVAIVDLKMEDMNGIEVLKTLKILDPLLVVIMLTGHGSKEAADQGLKLGAYDYLSKPYEFSKLLEKVVQASTYRRSLD